MQLCFSARDSFGRLAVNGKWMDGFKITTPEVQSFLNSGDGPIVTPLHYKRCSLKETMTVDKEMGGKEGKWQY